MKYKQEIDHILVLIKNNDKEGLRILSLLGKPDEFWLEMISSSPQARAWVARRRYLRLPVFLELCKFKEEELLTCLAANRKAPSETHLPIALFGGNPLRVLLKMDKPIDSTILEIAKNCFDPYIVAQAKTILGEPLDLELMERMILEYGENILHVYLTDTCYFRGFTKEALDRAEKVNVEQIKVYAKRHREGQGE